MTIYTDFVPPPRAMFVFSPVLDGTQYAAQVQWNLFGQRYFLNLYSLDGTRILTTPIIGSPDPVATSSLVWDGARQIVTITTATAHGIKLGQAALLTITGVSPDAFNGSFLCLATGTDTLDVCSNHRPPETRRRFRGFVGTDINLIDGLFETSTLVYREVVEPVRGFRP